MKALPVALLDEDDRDELLRWGIAAAVVLAAHAALIATYLLLHNPEPLVYGVPIVTVDLAPAPAAPELAPLDLPPEPQMERAEQQPEQKVEPKVEEPPPPPPKQPEAITEVAPPPKPKVERETKKLPAPKTTPRATAPTAGAPARNAKQLGVQTAEAKAASLRWEQLVMAHLQRNKQTRLLEAGVATVRFTVDRNGHVYGQRVVGSSGHQSLDAEALTIVSRSQPLPAFFPAMPEKTKTVTIPMRFNAR